jgi:ADP-ribose pyrophosphatase YjhB (NUDIX family)
VVVLDPDGRVLLFRYDDPPPMGVHWATPGGGIEPGESPREAAARELREETGWSDVGIGAELGSSSRIIDRGAGATQQHETHFTARVDVPQRTVGMAGHEVDSIAAWKWFAADALPHEPVWPSELPAYLSSLITRAVP